MKSEIVRADQRAYFDRTALCLPAVVPWAYEVIDQIEVGGKRAVYRAIDKSLGRQVAIKVLPEMFARDSERIARFEREARIVAALNHRHIAQIYRRRGPATYRLS